MKCFSWSEALCNISNLSSVVHAALLQLSSFVQSQDLLVLTQETSLETPYDSSKGFTVGRYRCCFFFFFLLLKAGLVALQKILEFQLILSKPPVFNYAQNEKLTKSLSVLYLE